MGSEESTLKKLQDLKAGLAARAWLEELVAALKDLRAKRDELLLQPLVMLAEPEVFHAKAATLKNIKDQIAERERFETKLSEQQLLPELAELLLIRKKLAGLDLVRSALPGLSCWDRGALGGLTFAMRPNVANAAAETALLFHDACPPIENHADVIEWVMATWSMVLKIAGSGDVDDETQDRLIAFLKELAKHEKETFKLHTDATLSSVGVTELKGSIWQNLPAFEWSFRQNSLDTDLPGVEPAEIHTNPQNWYKLSRFGALVMATGILPDTSGMEDTIVRVLRAALEYNPDLWPGTELPDWGPGKLKAACAWLKHGAAGPLLISIRERLSEGGPRLEDKIPGGPIYHGQEFLCLERWHFWLQRLNAIAAEESSWSEETRQDAHDAAEKMRDAEKQLSWGLKFDARTPADD